jgi:asparagine synthase (glutamine-hydrolysing)
MCGIAGTLVFDSSAFRVTEPFVTRMRETMVHRGPDGAGTWVSEDGRVGFGHRRLAIIDLSDAAAQPMCNEDGRLWITYNGEIYNHAELRAELEKIGGHVWKTDHSDTEVILHAFEEWGIGCLERFRGMFAFALWDAKARELWLVRDRIGIKPLYYSIHHGRISFASEIKALLEDPEQERAVDEEALFHYLSLRIAPPPRTLFEGVRKLPAATWLRVRGDGKVQESRYWDVWDHTEPLIGVSEEEIGERLLAELRTAVKLRKVSDVPVGVFLSGGIDSSANAALFSEGESRPVRTFSIGYDRDYTYYQNELHHARRVADWVGTEHHERVLNQDDVVALLPRMVWLQDEPIADPVCVPVFYVSELARNHGVIVCQVGEGADELFWGYPWWKRPHQLQRYSDLPIPRFAKRLGLRALEAANRRGSSNYEWLRRSAAGLPLFWGGSEAFSAFQKNQILSPRLREKFDGLSSWEVLRPIYDRFQDKAYERSRVHWMSYVNLNLRLPELLLARVDKMSMGVSLEGRVPFLDHKFVELAMSIPEAIKTKNGTLKYILKKAVRGVIPDDIIERRKQGFGVPVHDWLSDKLGERMRAELTDLARETDFIDPQSAMAVVDDARAPHAWTLLNFALWWKEFVA